MSAEDLAADRAPGSPLERSSAVVSAFWHAPEGMLVCEGPDHLVIAGNALGLRMVGDGVLGHPYRVGMANLEGQGLYEMFDATYRTGETLRAERWRVVREPGAPTTENFYTFSTAAWRGEDDEIRGVLITAVDVTEEVLADAARTERYAAARDVVWALQRNLLPDGLPILPQLRFAAQYHVAGAEMQAGGDWFDVVVIDARRVALVVGDVVGHGPAAAAAMARLNPILNELLMDGTALIAALDRLDRFAARHPATRAATVGVALLDQESGRLEFATRGHAPPLICRPDGTTRALTGGHAGPLGVGSGPSISATEQLDADAVLLLCSDGLWERPGSTAEVDQDRLVASVRAAMTATSRSYPSVVDRVCQFTVEFQARTGFSDDVTLLAAARRAHDVPALALDEPSTLDRLEVLHQRARHWLLTLGVGSAEAEDLGLAVYEAVANAAQHAYVGRSAGHTRLRGDLRADGTVRLSITDTGRWRAPRAGARGGRGLAIIRAVSDHVEVDMQERGTTVVLERRVRHPTVVVTGQMPVTAAIAPGDPFTVDTVDDPWPAIRVSGPIDVNTTPRLRRAISARDNGGVHPILVDLNQVSFLSSAGVQLLHELAGRHLRLTALPGSVAAHVLELNALAHLLVPVPAAAPRSDSSLGAG